MQNHLIRLSFAAFIVIFLASPGLCAGKSDSQVQVNYFADYVECWGVPQGVGPLSPEQCEHRSGHYRIHTVDQKVMRLEYVNAAGIPIPVTDPQSKDSPMVAVRSWR